MEQRDKTKAWQLYEMGVSYNQRLTPNRYDEVETNTEFFIGNQWLHLPDTAAMRGLQKPVFNILKRVGSLFIASLTSSGVKIRVEPLAYYDGSGLENPGEEAADMANAELETLLEKLKFEYRVRDALFDGCRTGDYCAHFWFDPEALPYGGHLAGAQGEIRMELVEGINVHFGNPNDPRTETQPYILLVGRDTVENLRREQRAHAGDLGGNPGGTPANLGDLGGNLGADFTNDAAAGSVGGTSAIENSEAIVEDQETEYITGVGGKTELEPDGESGKALFVLLYTKVRNPDGTETVHVTKATRTAVIYEDIDTGLSCYPIAWGNWEHQTNQYHGRSMVTGLLPNQIFINTMFATALRHLQLTAFPKTVYNGDRIPRWTNAPGEAVRVTGLRPGESLEGLAYVLPTANLSGQIFDVIDKVMGYTKDCLGATDAQMGNVKPDNTSALMVLQTNAEVPLENIRAGLYEWTEDVGKILLDMMGTYYGSRGVVTEEEFSEPVTGPDGAPQLDPMTGMMAMNTVRRKVVKRFDFSRLKNLWLRLRCDVGATTYFSEIAMTQTLDNLRRDGVLEVVDYLERIPDHLVPRKQELIREIRDRGMQQPPDAGAMPTGGAPGGPPQGEPTQGAPVPRERAAAALPAQIEGRLSKLPANAQRTALNQGAMRLRV